MQLNYPRSPGSKDNHGSADAADNLVTSGKHDYQIAIVKAVFKSHPERMSADRAWSLAPENSIDLHSFRSRTSELTRDRILIKYTDGQGKSITGKSASRYIWAEYAAPYQWDDNGQARFA